MGSQIYSWEWVTADKKLSDGPCELIGADLVVSAASTDTHLYNGRNTSGRKVITLESAVVTNMPWNPNAPVYCDGGLYIDIGTSVTGVLVRWRDLPTP